MLHCVLIAPASGVPVSPKTFGCNLSAGTLPQMACITLKHGASSWQTSLIRSSASQPSSCAIQSEVILHAAAWSATTTSGVLREKMHLSGAWSSLKAAAKGFETAGDHPCSACHGMRWSLPCRHRRAAGRQDQAQAGAGRAAAERVAAHAAQQQAESLPAPAGQGAAEHSADDQPGPDVLQAGCIS